MTCNIRRTSLMLTVLAFLLFPEPGKTDVEGRSCDPEQANRLIEYGDLITCSIDPIGDTDVFPFIGSAGEVILIRLNPLSGGSPCVALFGPDGDTLAGNCPLGIVGLNVRLPKTGIYTIQVTVWNHATMTYSIDLQCVGNCAALPFPIVEGVGEHLQVNGESLKYCPSLPSPTLKISNVEVIGKHLYVNGENFKDGAQVELNGDTIKTSNEVDFSHRLKCKKAGKKIQRGQTVLLVVRNPDGTKSQPFLYTRPA